MNDIPIINIHDGEFNERSYSFKSFQKYTEKCDRQIQGEIYKNFFNKKNNDIFYIASMFPYPSGEPHIGHIRNYTLTDIQARANILMNKKVFNMMGYDSYGLPAENAAKIRKIQANKWTYDNISHMQSIFKEFNFYDFGNFDLLITCDEKYYKHQQNFMKYLYKNGILYKKNSIVNWDPVEKTVLANEQVIDGRGWRSNAIIEKKSLNQWFIKTSSYANDLLKGIDTLSEWPENIKTMQRNWIGKSHGVHIIFKSKNNEEVKVFTTRPEVIFGCNFLSISNTSKITVKEVYNPYTNKLIPIVKADFVHEDYVTGVVMGVASTNDNDLNVAKKHNFEIINVVNDNGKMINSDFLNGMTILEARDVMKQIHENTTYFTIRDWCVSRQRAWGCIMPFINCEKCGIICSNEDVVNPPKDIDYSLNGNPLDHYNDWKNIKCYQCGGNSIRETDTMDTFVDSSWYLLRYPCQDNSKEMCDDRTWNCLPVDIYIGGAEHANGHLIYFRLFTYLICDYYNKKRIEPAIKLMNQGMIVSPVLIGKTSGHYYHISEVENGLAVKCIDDKFIGEEVVKGPNAKMSKSYKNFDSLITLMDCYGTDALRMFSVSDSPYDQEFTYDIRNISGCVNLLNRIWSIVYKFIYEDKVIFIENHLYKKLFKEIEKDMYDGFIKLKFNAMISNFHKIYRLYHNYEISHTQQLETILFIIKWLWCFCPSISTYAYDLLKQHKYVNKSSLYDERLDINFEIVSNINILKVYKNDTLAGNIEIDINDDESHIIKKATTSLNINNYKKYIYISKNMILKFIF